MAQKYHFAGIGGVGMAGVAFLLKKAGHDVSGCDLHPSPRTRWLEANGIPVAFGHAPSHITPGAKIPLAKSPRMGTKFMEALQPG